MSDRLRGLVVAALRGRYDVTAVDTEARGHAKDICREAREGDYDVVVSFGGDGTVNEAANGLAGSDVPLTCLPGGATNVFCRMLGIPNDIVDATEHLLRIADDWRPRRVDLARVNGRHFTFSSGVGLDASVVERVDRHPRMKTQLGAWYFTYAAITTFLRRYVVGPPRLEAELPDGRRFTGVTVVVQNADPFTYFRRRPIRVADDGSLDDGLLGGAVLRRSTPTVMPTVITACSPSARGSAATARSTGSAGSRSWSCARSTAARSRWRSTATTSARSRGPLRGRPARAGRRL